MPGNPDTTTWAYQKYAMPEDYRKLLCQALEKEIRECQNDSITYEQPTTISAYTHESRANKLRTDLTPEDSDLIDWAATGASCSGDRAELLKRKDPSNDSLSVDQVIEYAILFCIGKTNQGEPSTNAKVLLAWWERDGTDDAEIAARLQPGRADYAAPNQEPNAAYVMWFLLQIPNWGANKNKLIDDFLAITTAQQQQADLIFNANAFVASVKELVGLKDEKRIRRWAHYIKNGNTQSQELFEQSDQQDLQSAATGSDKWLRMCDCLASGFMPLYTEKQRMDYIQWRTP